MDLAGSDVADGAFEIANLGESTIIKIQTNVPVGTNLQYWNDEKLVDRHKTMYY